MKIYKLILSFTLAAIYTCTLSSFAFAAWTPDAPTKLGTNLSGIAMDATDGLVAVGDDGKAYHMTKAKMESTTAADVDWAPVYPPASTNFVGVAHDGAAFWAATSNGTIVTSANGITWTVSPLSAAARAAITGKTVVGIACPEDGGAPGDVVVVTNDGGVAYYDSSDIAWTSAGANLAGETIATSSSIKGVRALTGTNDAFVVFGGGGGANLYNVASGGVLTATLTVTNCPIINDISVQSAALWYAVGDSAKVVRGTTGLGGSGTEGSAALTISGTGTVPNLLSVKYDNSNTFGYTVGADGSVFRISGTVVTFKTQAVSSANLNGVELVQAGALRRAFAIGNDGASLYGGETFWAAVLTGTTQDATDAPLDPQSILALSSTYYIPNGVDKKLYYSTAPTTSWTGLATASTPTVAEGAIIGATVTAVDYVATKVTPGAALAQVTVFKSSDGSAALITAAVGVNSPATADYLATLVNGGTTNLYFAGAAATKDVQFIDITSVTASSVQAAANVVGAVTGLAGTTNGLYIIDATVVKAMAAGGGTLVTLPNAANDWVTASQIETAVATAQKLFQTSDGNLIVIDGAPGVFLVEDSSNAAIATALTVTNLNYPVGAGAPTSVSGSSTDLVVSTATDVWRYTSTGWEKYDNLSVTLPKLNNVDGVASSGANVVAMNQDGTATNRGIGYSTGSTFTPAAPDTQPDVGSTINTIYNATSTDIYVGGDNGLLYKGVYSSSTTSFTWTRVTEGILGAKAVNKITGFGTTVFALINGGTEMVMFDGSTWSAVTNNPPVTYTNLKAASATTLYATAANGVNSVYKITMVGSTATHTPQGQTSGTITDLTAIDVSADGQTLYAVGSSNNAYKLTLPATNNWTVTKITMPGVAPASMYDVTIQDATKIYMVGASGYAVSYDGTTASLLTAPAATILNSVWSYETDVFAADSNGQVHQYSTTSSSWTSGTASTGKNIKAVTGSVSSGFLVAGGQDGVLSRTTISSSGGGEDSSEAQPGVGEDADLITTASATTPTSTTLTTTYNTPSMTVLGKQQSFTTKAITAASTHNFLYTFTPATNMAVNDLKLYKLLSATSSNILFSRMNSAPASATDGVYWITNAASTVIVSGETLTAGTVYTVNFGIKDNGSYDTSATAGVIQDPVVLGSSSSGSSGCIFNPAQGISIEWLLMFLVPFVAIIRTRFKR